MYLSSEITPRMITMTRTICLARPSIGNRLTRYRIRITTRKVTSAPTSIEIPLLPGRREAALLNAPTCVLVPRREPLQKSSFPVLSPAGQKRVSALDSPGIHAFAVVERRTWMAGQRRAEATPSFGRLRPGHDGEQKLR